MKLAHLLSQFRLDDRGAFIAVFGLVAVVLVTTSGAVVDFVSLEQTRTRAQLALDTAALALQADIATKSNTDLKSEAQALLRERLSDATVTANVEAVTTDANEGLLRIDARVTVQMNFLRLFGIETVSAALVSEATRKRLYMEVAMVLDNSGSMLLHNRMTYLKQAATNATNILFSDEATQPNVFVSIVPFTTMVNVGSGNANASWLDRNGVAPISNDNFDNDDDDATPFTGAVDRLALMEKMNGVEWEGCVEARATPLDTTDATPTSSDPSTLFTPQFAPDEPAGYPNNYLPDFPAICTTAGTCQVRAYQTCNASWNCNGSFSEHDTNVYNSSGSLLRTGGPVNSATSVCTCSGIATTTTSFQNMTVSGTRVRVRTMSCSPHYAQNLSSRELQERICKYNGTTPDLSSGDRGPNANCPTASIVPLTNERDVILDSIEDMVADGGTNIHEGAAWGMRVLSPSEPFTEARDIDQSTYKIMILMTDGENYNSHQNYSSNINGTYFYTAYGHRWNGRLAPNATNTYGMTAEMNSRTAAACASAKAAGITVYSIGLSTEMGSYPTENRAVLTNCASDASKAYFPSSPTELNSIFQEIALQLSDLRLAR